MQDKFNSVNIYEIKASVNDRQIDETFLLEVEILMTQ